jgi:hypothetical protein
MQFKMKAVEDDEWTDDGLVPLAAIGHAAVDAAVDDEAFLGKAYAYLFHDREAGAILYATDDNWSRDHQLDGGLDALGLVPA